MKSKRILVVVLVAGLLCALNLGPGLAQGPEERDEPRGTVAVEAVVSSKFTYQGMLSEDGTPVTGTRDMEFGLFTDDTCTTQIDTIPKPGVEVNGGLFSVELTVIADDVNGQGLWLGIEVEGTTVGCQEILPVPYALSLRPGATIEGEQTNWDALHVQNDALTGHSYGLWSRTNSTEGRGVYGWASADSGTTYGVFGHSGSTSGTGVYGLAGADSGTTYGVVGLSSSSSGTGVHGQASAYSGTTYGVFGESDSSSGRGVYGLASADSGMTFGVFGESDSSTGIGVYGRTNADSGMTYGVVGRSDSSSGAGVYAMGLDLGADLVLGANDLTTSGDDGRITSDLLFPSSDIVLVSNDTVRIDLDDDGDGEDADFEIYNKDNTLIFDVDDSGDVSFGGTGLTAFPRPAYDSGWVSVDLGAEVVRTHNLGGNVDNYVVDLTCRNTGGEGINNWGVGGDANGSQYYGAWWSDLTTTSITLNRWSNDSDCPNMRVRIWVYP